MSLASDLSSKSRTERVTAADIQASGAKWNHEKCAWEFPDGSFGIFGKKTVLRGTKEQQFDHYLFEEVV